MVLGLEVHTARIYMSLCPGLTWMIRALGARATSLVSIVTLVAACVCSGITRMLGIRWVDGVMTLWVITSEVIVIVHAAYVTSLTMCTLCFMTASSIATG